MAKHKQIISNKLSMVSECPLQGFPTMSRMPLHFPAAFTVVAVLFLSSCGKVCTAEGYADSLEMTEGETVGFNGLLLNMHV